MLLRLLHHPAEPAHLTVLHEVPLFSDLPRHQLDTLNDLLHRRHYVAGEVVFDENEEGQAIYFILSGHVHINYGDLAEPLAALGPGQYFGERALLENMARVAQARAAEDCTLAVLFRDDFLHLLHTHPEIADKITHHCIQRDIPRLMELPSHPVEPHAPRDIGPVTWTGIIVVTCLLLLIFKKLLWLVVPFLLALILYYLLAPLSKKMVQAGVSRQVAAVALSGAFLLGTAAAVLMFYPLAMTSAASWQNTLSHYLAGGASMLQQLLDGLRQKFSFLQSAQFGDDIYQQVQDFTEHFSDKYLSRFVVGVAAWLPSLLLTPIIAFFLLKDAAYLRKMVGGAVPNAFFEKTLYLIYAVNRTARLYFVGLIKIAAIDTCLMAVGLWALGMAYPLLLGLMVAILCWIPYLGPLLGFMIITIIAATDFPGNVSLIYGLAGLFLVMRLLDDLVFLPLIVGKSLRIHPLVTILMFLVGEAIAGIAGLMLVIPILGIVMVLGETLALILADKRLRARHAQAQRLRWEAANRGL